MNLKDPNDRLEIPESKRKELWTELSTAVESYIQEAKNLDIFPNTTPQEIRSLLKGIDFEKPQDPVQSVRFAVENLKKYQIHFSNPAYLGLFVPQPAFMSVLADAISNAFSCNLATWRAAPFAVELEQHLLKDLSRKIGYGEESVGLFTSGGSEANHTAILLGISSRVPSFVEKGLFAAQRRPLVYLSRESHHSLHKAVVAIGLGKESIREIDVDDQMRMKMGDLRKQIELDLAQGHQPCILVATAGTTNSGAIDNIQASAELAKQFGMWFHVDAAYGGSCAILPELKSAFSGLEQADSVTLDPHKLFSISMGCGVVLTKKPQIMKESFQINFAPLSKTGLSDVFDPFINSMIWSRRFIGLKLFLTLSASGWPGLVNTVRHHCKMAHLLTQKLESSGWKTVTSTELPVICFIDSQAKENLPERNQFLAKEVVESGESWISSTVLGGRLPALRASIVNRLTEEKHLDKLVELLNRARDKYNSSAS
jgi:aromatic-L-amino-acid decarboxylase